MTSEHAWDVRPLPDVSDSELAPYWQGAAEGRLLVQRCAICGTKRWPPRPACADCGGLHTAWVEVPGAGRVYSWTEVHRTRLDYFRSKLPYTVAIVELADDPRLRMIGLLTVETGDCPDFGMDVRADFQRISDNVYLVYWRATS
jgi:uncharacterized OB-fold protein